MQDLATTSLAVTALLTLFVEADKRGRGLWYRLAFYAGHRRGEPLRMLVKDIYLEGNTISVPRGKAKRTDILPIHPDLREHLAEAIQSSLPGANVFVEEVLGPVRKKDYEAAGIELVDDRNRVVDLHALRVTLATFLARSGVHPKNAQRLLRHSTIEMTLRYYTKPELSDDRKALESISLGDNTSPHHRPHQLERESVQNGAAPCEQGETG